MGYLFDQLVKEWAFLSRWPPALSFLYPGHDTEERDNCSDDPLIVVSVLRDRNHMFLQLLICMHVMFLKIKTGSLYTEMNISAICLRHCATDTITN